MNLSDVMSHAGLWIYAVIAMVIFMAAFVGIVIWLFRPSHRNRLEQHRDMPLSDDDDRKSQGGARK